MLLTYLTRQNAEKNAFELNVGFVENGEMEAKYTESIIEYNGVQGRKNCTGTIVWLGIVSYDLYFPDAPTMLSICLIGLVMQINFYSCSKHNRNNCLFNKRPFI